MKKSAWYCLVEMNKFAEAQKLRNLQVDKFEAGDKHQNTYKKAFRKFIYSLEHKCFKDISENKAKSILTRIKNELLTSEDMAHLKNADMYKVENSNIVGSGDFQLTADEEKLMNGFKQDAEFSKQDKIKIIQDQILFLNQMHLIKVLVIA